MSGIYRIGCRLRAHAAHFLTGRQGDRQSVGLVLASEKLRRPHHRHAAGAVVNGLAGDKPAVHFPGGSDESSDISRLYPFLGFFLAVTDIDINIFEFGIFRLTVLQVGRNGTDKPGQIRLGRRCV